MVTEFQQLRNFTNKCKKQNRRNSFCGKTTIKLIFLEKNGRCYSEFIKKTNKVFKLTVEYFCVLCSRACCAGMVCVLLTIKKKIILKNNKQKKLEINVNIITEF